MKLTPDSIGRVVHYRLTVRDVTKIDDQRPRGNVIRASERIGNVMHAGEVVAALIVKVWGDVNQSVNLRVFVDGEFCLWVTQVQPGTDLGQWFEPGVTVMSRVW